MSGMLPGPVSPNLVQLAWDEDDRRQLREAIQRALSDSPRLSEPLRSQLLRAERLETYRTEIREAHRLIGSSTVPVREPN